ncbi:MAG: SUF system Fe-S cluster assembly regulator [Alphaproteobacteria bacterium]|nr:SUF system Fe-S cluster assembly regulator [Alphaproteobacteria bacterium]
MIRLTRLADYAVLLMTHLGHEWARHPDRIHNAGGLSAETHIPTPTVSKLLGVMSRGGLLVSHRGQAGGYSLARAPEAISVADIVGAVDGPIALTDCLTDDSDCGIESLCGVRTSWQKINRVIRHALSEISLAELCADQLQMFAPRKPAARETVSDL